MKHTSPGDPAQQPATALRNHITDVLRKWSAHPETTFSAMLTALETVGPTDALLAAIRSRVDEYVAQRETERVGGGFVRYGFDDLIRAHHILFHHSNAVAWDQQRAHDIARSQGDSQ